MVYHLHYSTADGREEVQLLGSAEEVNQAVNDLAQRGDVVTTTFALYLSARSPFRYVPPQVIPARVIIGENGGLAEKTVRSAIASVPIAHATGRAAAVATPAQGMRLDRRNQAARVDGRRRGRRVDVGPIPADQIQNGTVSDDIAARYLAPGETLLVFQRDPDTQRILVSQTGRPRRKPWAHRLKKVEEPVRAAAHG